jgi:Uncharacterized conserved protein (DUF2190)
MAFQENIQARTYTASAAIAQFVFVTMPDANNKVATLASGTRSAGVALAAAAGDGSVLPVAYDGRVQVLAGASITAGAAVMSNASGRAITATATNTVLGYAIEGGANNQVITIELARSERVA